MTGDNKQLNNNNNNNNNNHLTSRPAIFSLAQI